MKIETLKKLIELEINQCETMYEFKEKVIALIDMFEFDSETSNLIDNSSDEIPYHQICGCNPVNGGSGVCGCMMGNKMVKKYYKEGIHGSNTSITLNK
jgi:hypothetical protein